MKKRFKKNVVLNHYIFNCKYDDGTFTEIHEDAESETVARMFVDDTFDEMLRLGLIESKPTILNIICKESEM